MSDQLPVVAYITGTAQGGRWEPVYGKPSRDALQVETGDSDDER